MNMKDSTCYQTSRLFCSRSTSTWLHHSESPNVLLAEALYHPHFEANVAPISGLPSPPPPIGPVCGLDPEFCAEPRSTGPFTWSSTDVTEWPVRVEMCTFCIHLHSKFNWLCTTAPAWRTDLGRN